MLLSVLSCYLLVEIVNMKKSFLICLILLLCSCTRTLKSPIVTSRPNLDLPEATAIKLDKVEFKVLHEDNVESFFKDSNKNGKDIVIFALTESNYKNLALNMKRIKALIKNQKKIIELYKKYYEENDVGEKEER